MDLEYLLENPKGRCLPRFIRANFPIEYETISKLPGDKFSEKIYRYFNPDTKNECVVCGGPTKFKKITEGFARTCCVACAAKDPQRISKSKQTCLERYGDSNKNESFEDLIANLTEDEKTVIKAHIKKQRKKKAKKKSEEE